MSKKPDLSELFQMLSEEKVKRSVEQDKKSKKSKKIQKDFMEEFSAEIKKLKEQEEQHKRDVAAMEAWLTSPVEEKNEEVEEIIEEHIVDIPEVPIEIADEPVPIEEEIVAETPLQEQALKYLNTKRQELTEEQQSVKILEKQIEDVKKSITSIRLGLQGQGGGGISKLSQADDIDRATALVNDKFLKYNATTGKFVGADGGGGASAFADLTGKPTTIAGYGITDAFDGAYSSLTGTPTIPTVSNDFTNDDHSKLDGIEASADVTDTANVTAAGALMDSEVTNLAQVKAFDSSDYATAAQGVKADSALQSFTETNDLSAAVVWANVPNTNITQGSVTQHQAALSITESQISDLGSYATLASPTLTGTPAAPTASTGTNTTQIATTAFVKQEIDALKALLYAYDQS